MMKKTISMLAICLMLVVALSPIMQEPVEAAPAESDPESDEYGLIGTLLAIGIAFGVGFALGWYVKENQAPNQPAVDTEQIRKQFRDSEYMTVDSGLGTLLTVANTILPSDANIVSLTSEHWQRAMELAVSKTWTLDSDIDMEELLEMCLMRSSMDNYVYNWQGALDKSFYNILKRQQYWTGDTYSDISVSLMMGSESFGYKTTDLEKMLYLDMVSVCKPTSTNDRIYIDNETADGEVSALSKTLYIFGSTNERIRLQRVATGAYTQDLTVGINDISTLPSGEYILLNHDVTYAGMLTPSSSLDRSAPLNGGMVAVANKVPLLITKTSDGMQSMSVTGQKRSFSSLTIKLDVNGERNSAEEWSIAGLLDNYNTLVTNMANVYTKAVNAGAAIWGVFDTIDINASDRHWISPSSMNINVEGVALSAAQSQATYMMAMQKIYDMYKANEDSLRDVSIDLTKGSYGLICYGDIFYEGALVVENAVFTPYAYSKSITLKTTETVNWNQDGSMAMVWGTIDDFDSWNGMTSLSMEKEIPLSTKSTLNLKKIIYTDSNGNDIDTESLDLTITTIDRYVDDSWNGSDAPSEPTDMFDSKMLFMIIFIVFGAFLVMVGVAVRSPLVVIIGAVVALILVALLHFGLLDGILSNFKVG